MTQNLKKHFYIFRHGQSVWNAEGRPHGQHPFPVPLTLNGQEQAKELANQLKDKKIKIIVTSDLLRAKQTADIVGNILNADVVEDVRLREIDYGVLNGLYTLDREEVFPEFKRCYEDVNFPFLEGECFADVAKRMKNAIEDCYQSYNHRNIGISTHSHSIEAFILDVFHYKCCAPKNCGYIHVTYDGHQYEGIELPLQRTY